MKKIIVFLTLILSVTLHAQTAFEKGNFVNKQNQVVECLIKNYDWTSIPKQIEYKTSEEGVVETISAENIASFYIYATSHMYKTFDVPVVGIQKGDVFVKSGPQLLKVLVEGKASLLKNNDGIYFLHFDGDPVKPLIYKKYIYNDVVEENVSFRLELYNALKCGDSKADSFKKLKYIESRLINAIKEYNKCQDAQFKDYTDRKTKAEFSLNALAGVNFYTSGTSLRITDRPDSGNATEVDVKGGFQSNIVVGFEAEVKLPFNHKKWALFIVPTFNIQNDVSEHVSGKTSYTVPGDGFSGDGFSGGSYPLNYRGNIIFKSHSYIEIPIGLRHYFLLNKDSSLNVSAAYGISINIGSDENLSFVPDANSVKMYPAKSGSSHSLIRLGAGYTFKEKYSLGLNYYIFKELSQSKSNGSLSLLLGYKLF